MSLKEKARAFLDRLAEGDHRCDQLLYVLGLYGYQPNKSVEMIRELAQ